MSRGDNGRFLELMDGVVDDDERAEGSVPYGYHIIPSGREEFAVACFLTDVEVDQPDDLLEMQIEAYEYQEARQNLADQWGALGSLEHQSAALERQIDELMVELIYALGRLAQARKRPVAAAARVQAADGVDWAEFDAHVNDDLFLDVDEFNFDVEPRGMPSDAELAALADFDEDWWDDIPLQEDDLEPDESLAKPHPRHDDILSRMQCRRGSRGSWQSHHHKPRRPKGAPTIRRMAVAV